MDEILIFRKKDTNDNDPTGAVILVIRIKSFDNPQGVRSSLLIFISDENIS